MEMAETTSNPLSLGQVIKIGLDGRLYRVFPSGAELDLYNERDPHKRYVGKQVYCADGYDNAVCLEE